MNLSRSVSKYTMFLQTFGQVTFVVEERWLTLSVTEWREAPWNRLWSSWFHGHTNLFLSTYKT